MTSPTIGGEAENRNSARLNEDGTPDSTFNPQADNSVHSIALQPDGEIAWGGWFTSVGGQTRKYIARLSEDGTTDSSFSGNANLDVSSIAVQADGKILIGGG